MKKTFLILTTLNILLANNLTIYTNNLANVDKSIDYNFTQGLNRVVYKNLPNTIIKDSIYAKFNSNINVISQSFIEKKSLENLLLSSNLNKNISFYKTDNNIADGKLISISPIVVESKSKYYLIDNPKKIIYTKYPKNFNSYIEWQVNSNKSFSTKYDLNYFLNGLSWLSNYRIAIKDDKLVLDAYASINNKTDIDFKDSNITLIAGNINSHTQNYKVMQKRAMVAVKTLSFSDEPQKEIKAKKIGSYYKYKLPYTTNIKSKETKEVHLFDKKELKYKRFAQAKAISFNDKQVNLKFTENLEFNNTLNIPLPKGKVRIYKDNNFLGESWIDNSTNNQLITIKVGEMFDIYGEKVVTNSVTKKNYRAVDIKYTLHNKSSKKVELRVEENAPTYGDKIKFTNSCEDNCTVVKESAFVNSYRVNLDANSSYSFTTKVEIFN